MNASDSTVKRNDIPWRIERLPKNKYLFSLGSILMLAFFFEAVDNGAIGYLLPIFAKEFKLDSAALGFLGSVSSIGTMVGGIIAGLITDKFGRKKVIIGSMILWGISGIFLANAWDLNSLMVFRVLLGIGLGAQVPVTIVMLSELVPSRMRAAYITGVYAMMPLGSAVAGLISYFVLPLWGWHWVVVIEAVPALAALLVWKLVPESPMWLGVTGRYEEADKIMSVIEGKIEKALGEPLPPVQMPTAEPSKAKAPKMPLSEIFSWKYLRSTIMISIWYPLGMAGGTGLTTWFSTLLVGKGFEITKSIGIVTLMTLGGALSVPFSRFLLEKVGRKWTVVIAGVVLAGSAYLYGAAASVTLVVVAGLFYNLCLYVAVQSNGLYAAELYPTRIRGTAIGYANAIGRVGAIFGPIAIGLIMNGYGLTPVFIFATSLYFIYSIAVAVLGRETRGIVFDE